MRLLRYALLDHPMLALAIGFAGLILRLAVPAGFMPVLQHGQLTLTICSGSAVESQPAAGAAPAGAEHHDEGKPRADNNCAFADLALPLIGGADSVQLTAALLFAAAAALFFAAILPPRAMLRLRPPLRGPPLPA